MTGYLLTSRVDGPALGAMSRHEARWYFNFRSGDLKAQWSLANLYEQLYEAQEMDGVAALWNAAQYLKDRAAYAAACENRPPGKRVILMQASASPKEETP